MEWVSKPVYAFGNVAEMMKTYGLSALLAFTILFLVSYLVNSALLYYVGGILFLASFLAPTVSRWRPKKRIPIDGKAVFISGCDTGFGYMLAQRLDDIGFRVFAGCLFPEGDGAESLRKSGSKRLHVIGLDVTSDSSIENAVTYVEKNLGDNVLWAVVNNAGIVEVAELSWVSVESILRTVDVNTFGVIRLTKAFLLKLKESQGRVVTVASQAGRFPVPNLVPYCVSKTASIAFCDGLRLEMYKWKIEVITVEPAVYRTPLSNKEEVEKKSRMMWASVPENVKNECGSDNVEKKIEKLLSFVKYLSRNPSEVVSVIEEALTALYPECRYAPGSFICFVICWLYNVIPKPLSDVLANIAADLMSK